MQLDKGNQGGIDLALPCRPSRIEPSPIIRAFFLHVAPMELSEPE